VKGSGGGAVLFAAANPFLERSCKTGDTRSLHMLNAAQAAVSWEAMRTWNLLMASALTTFAFGLAGCRTLPPSKPSTEWTPQEARGAAVFNQKCARCHYPTTTAPLHGPGLQAITKVKAMPSGAPPTDERLTAVIVDGRGMMPATQLNDEDLADLLAYLHTL
jgi:mono/diheme cytochrome c family protein